jgi:Leucine-rich repeat (LRR) protein
MPALVSRSRFTGRNLDISDNAIKEIDDGQVAHDLRSFTSRNNPINFISDHAFFYSENSMVKFIIQYSKMTSNFFLIRASSPVTYSPMFPNLVLLDLSHNSIKDLSNLTALNLYKNLSQINLENNEIHDISPLVGVNVIKYLNLDNNKICDHVHIPFALASAQRSMETLSLSSNCLNYMPDFSRMTKLTYLLLNNNNIKNINHGLLPLSLKYLNMYGNKLSSVPDAMADLVNLEILDLQNNEITSIPDMSGMTKLKTLQLYNNDIKQIDRGFLPLSLTYLQLGFNGMQSIPEVVSELINLQSLSVGDNEITSIDTFEFPSSLTYINLNYNHLEKITSFIFSQGMSNLQALHLENNPIKTIDKDAFKDMPDLKNMYLSNTNLERLPLAMQGLTSLRILHLDNIANLTCTCTESVLGSWYHNLTSLSVYGQCDGADVETFLDTLAGQCP